MKEVLMSLLTNPFKRLIAPPQPIPPGIYHYQSPPEDPRNYRLHLRLNEQGGGTLIVNASVILHLNQTAAEYAYFLVKNAPASEVGRYMNRRYEVSATQAKHDYEEFCERIQTLVSTPDLDPVMYLGFERQKPLSGEITAPYRLDCALTYRLPNEQTEEALSERVARELSTSEWCTIFEKAWNAGIPHLVFTGGEPTLREDLPALIAYAERLGQVTGLLTDGLRFAETAYLGEVLQAGLDHLMLVLHPENPLSWQAVHNVLVEDLYVVVHLTITEATKEKSGEYLQRLADMGVQHLSLSASDPSFAEALAEALQKAAFLDMDLVWNLPVPYSSLHPIALEAEDARIEGAGRAWLYVEPDGDVRPTQGDPRLLGNLLRDEFALILSNLTS